MANDTILLSMAEELTFGFFWGDGNDDHTVTFEQYLTCFGDE